MRAHLLGIAYQVRSHSWGGWSLDRWLVGLAVVAAVALGLAHLPGVLNLEFGAWLPVIVLALAAVAIVLFGRWAAGQHYVVFLAESLPAPAGQPLQPIDKVLLRATGAFEVEGKSHFFAHLLAYWRTFATREHAVMAIVHRTRFLLLATMPAGNVGMWYMFWCPEKMVGLEPGSVCFGRERRPGLRAVYDTPEISAAERRSLPFWQRKRKFSRRQTVYLSFDDERSRQQVWADLLADWRPGPSPE